MTTSKSPKDYTISGIKVKFPCRAYPSQIAMMNKIINGLQRCQNCLLESPTGSGKSLALLCAALAWQENEKARIKALEAAEELGLEIYSSQDGLPEGHLVSTKEDRENQERFNRGTGGGFMPVSNKDKNDEPMDVDDYNDNEDFKPAIRGNNSKMATNPRDIPHEGSVDNLEGCGDPDPVSPERKNRLPKIYFGTRTHKQITQIVREFGKTVYKDAPMTILASRDHTCIHPQVSRLPNKQDRCAELIENKTYGEKCQFYNNTHRINRQASLADSSIPTPWDIEDLVTLGKKRKACPYFASRGLQDEALIVFCPYNYLIDPEIRSTMRLNLKGQILILDEAHNMEDTARESMSFDLTEEESLVAMRDFEVVGSDPFSSSCRDSYDALNKMLSKVMNWVTQESQNMKDYVEFGKASKILSGTEILGVMKQIGMDENDVKKLEGHLHTVTQHLEETLKLDDSNLPTLKRRSLRLCGRFLSTLNLLSMNGLKHCDDYKAAIVRERKEIKPSYNQSEWMSARSVNKQYGWLSTLHFWCLNPALAFLELKQELRSIVLTSGTLSPIISFQSELGIPFQIQLEANHVIQKEQIWIGSIINGPSNKLMNGTYQHVDTFDYQDELGRIVLQVCEVVKYGVLCFLPSYRLLESLSQRWKLTGLWRSLEDNKYVVVEPRSSDSLEDTMAGFYEANACPGYQCKSQTGALFLAVCRGKVSEGLDFANNNARAVITVGIPLPNFKDIKVDLKKKYNDKHHSSRSLLDGRSWYEIQAYRALNQALGRCLRHSRDWGALVLVDERFSKNPRHVQGLSKWMRSGIRHYDNFHVAMSSLADFVRLNEQNDELMEQEEGSTAAGAVMPDSHQGPREEKLSDFEDKVNLSENSTDLSDFTADKVAAGRRRARPRPLSPSFSPKSGTMFRFVQASDEDGAQADGEDSRSGELQELVSIFEQTIGSSGQEGSSTEFSDDGSMSPSLLNDCDRKLVPEGLERPIPQGLERPTLQGLERPTLQGLERPTLQGLERPTLQGLERPTPQSLQRPTPQSLQRPTPPDRETPARDKLVVHGQAGIGEQSRFGSATKGRGALVASKVEPTSRRSLSRSRGGSLKDSQQSSKSKNRSPTLKKKVKKIRKGVVFSDSDEY